ncbi:GNAT family N-acetyltransferase [Oligoflexus tunisiensis]|uniref:GNAT family N-acetyltransferase n=1 Tax=Oligoflexus tunisiensis TaxID=708132 RepID=UPI00114CCEB5|nr:GNAT family N-acetyltransferase [Oligoflexus tunisiensis]
MPQELRFRDCQRQDHDRCLAIFDGNTPEFFAFQEREAFERYLTKERLPYFVVEDGQGIIVACGGFVIERGEADLAWGMVERSVHGQGIGTFLFDQRLEAIRKTGASVLHMDTSQKSLGFYKRYGFRVEKETLNGYGPGLHRYDLCLNL